MNSKFIAVLAVAVIVVAGVGVAYFVVSEDNDSGVVGVDVDFAGRPIKPVENLDNGIAAVGQDSFRWATYFGVAKDCVMVDTNDRTNFMGKQFMYVGRALSQVDHDNLDDFTHTNCSLTDADVKHILKIRPSLVIVPEGFYTDIPNHVEALNDAGLNVVAIGYVYTFLEPETFKISERLDQQINLMGKVLNKQNRAAELKETINNTVKDIRNIASKTVTKRTGYVGALAYNGAHGTDSSIGFFIPFALAGVENIMASDAIFSGSGVDTYSATKIKESMKDDTVLFIDATGTHMCNDNTSRGIQLLFKGHDAFVLCPYIWTGINYESVLIASYQVLKDAYGLLTEDEFEEKVKSVYEGFLGTHISNRNVTASGVAPPPAGTTIYEDMNSLYVKRRGAPIYGEIEIRDDGSLAFLALAS